MTRVKSILILYSIVYTEGVLQLVPRRRVPESKSIPRDHGDADSPLFLTPYIESGNVEEGRRLARVNLTDFPHLESYAGFITVNKTYNSNHFFWYFPPTSTPVKSNELILWLQGGPGGSSLYGLFNENGPIVLENRKPKLRKYHWAQNHDIIYIDNPVGTGFSFTNGSQGYCTNEVQIAEHLYTTVTQFLKLFPKLQQYRFYITGESYAGKYIPALAYMIHKKNPSAEIKIRLTGMAIGDGWCDPINQADYSEYLYQTGFVDWNIRKQLEYYQYDFAEQIKQENWRAACDAWVNLLHRAQISAGVSMYNYATLDKSDKNEQYANYVRSPSVRRSIHVGNLTFFDSNQVVADNLYEDMMQSVAPWISELLEHYHMLFYNGQLDVIVAYPLTINFLRKLNFSGIEAYERAPREKLRLHYYGTLEQAVYLKRAGNLWDALIRNAGHMVPEDQPIWALEMLDIWINHTVAPSDNLSPASLHV